MAGWGSGRGHGKGRTPSYPDDDEFKRLMKRKDEEVLRQFSLPPNPKIKDRGGASGVPLFLPDPFLEEPQVTTNDPQKEEPELVTQATVGNLMEERSGGGRGRGRGRGHGRALVPPVDPMEKAPTEVQQGPSRNSKEEEKVGVGRGRGTGRGRLMAPPREQNEEIPPEVQQKPTTMASEEENGGGDRGHGRGRDRLMTPPGEPTEEVPPQVPQEQLRNDAEEEKEGGGSGRDRLMTPPREPMEQVPLEVTPTPSTSAFEEERARIGRGRGRGASKVADKDSVEGVPREVSKKPTRIVTEEKAGGGRGRGHGLATGPPRDPLQAVPEVAKTPTENSTKEEKAVGGRGRGRGAPKVPIRDPMEEIPQTPIGNDTEEEKADDGHGRSQSKEDPMEEAQSEVPPAPVPIMPVEKAGIGRGRGRGAPKLPPRPLMEEAQSEVPPVPAPIPEQRAGRGRGRGVFRAPRAVPQPPVRDPLEESMENLRSQVQRPNDYYIILHIPHFQTSGLNVAFHNIYTTAAAKDPYVGQSDDTFYPWHGDISKCWAIHNDKVVKQLVDYSVELLNRNDPVHGPYTVDRLPPPWPKDLDPVKYQGLKAHVIRASSPSDFHIILEDNQKWYDLGANDRKWTHFFRKRMDLRKQTLQWAGGNSSEDIDEYIEKFYCFHTPYEVFVGLSFILTQFVELAHADIPANMERPVPLDQRTYFSGDLVVVTKQVGANTFAYRAVIIEPARILIAPDMEQEEECFLVYLLDTGERRVVSKYKLLHLPRPFICFRPLAIPCSLDSISPLNPPEWGQDARYAIRSMFNRPQGMPFIVRFGEKIPRDSETEFPNSVTLRLLDRLAYAPWFLVDMTATNGESVAKVLAKLRLVNLDLDDKYLEFEADDDDKSCASSNFIELVHQFRDMDFV